MGKKNKDKWNYYTGMRSDTFNKLNKQQLKKALKVMNKKILANKNAIENKGLTQKSLFREGKNEIIPTWDLDIEKLNYGQLKQTAYRARNFLMSSIGTVEGVEKTQRKQLEAFREAGVLSERQGFREMNDLLRIYSKLEDNLSDFTIRFGRLKYDIFGIIEYAIRDGSIDYDKAVIDLMELLDESSDAKIKRQEKEDNKQKTEIGKVSDEMEQ